MWTKWFKTLKHLKVGRSAETLSFLSTVAWLVEVLRIITQRSLVLKWRMTRTVDMLDITFECIITIDMDATLDVRSSCALVAVELACR